MKDLTLRHLLQKHAAAFGPVLLLDLSGPQVCRLDLTAGNPCLAGVDLRDTAAFDALVNELLTRQQATVGIGGYTENRVIYRRSAHFGGPDENRSVHLGVDIWVPAGTPVLAPFDGAVHSFRDNNHFGDYGPTIILEHQLEGQVFYTLYGHLTRSSLAHLEPGLKIEKGREFTQVGPYPENGDWPPHLHFQVIRDMLGLSGDFPGVCTPAEKEKFCRICPDPNLVLQSRVLAS